MRTIFIISSSQDDFNLFINNFRHLAVHFSWVGDLKESLRYLQAENPVYIFFVSREIEQFTAWLDLYREYQLTIPFLCFTTALEWPEREMLWQGGATDIIRLPLNRREVEFILSKLLKGMEPQHINIEDGLQGQLTDLSLPDLIRLYENSNRSGVLTLKSGTHEGIIEFEQGKVINAGFGKSEPVESICIMSTWVDGNFSAMFDKQKRRGKIVLENEQIIMECREQMQLYQSLQAKLPDPRTLFFTRPDLDYETFGPGDRSILLFFKNGRTLQEYLDQSDGNPVEVMRRFNNWINQRNVLSEEQLREYNAQTKLRQDNSGLRKIMNKLLNREEQPVKAARSPETQASPEEAMARDFNRRSHQFNDGGRINRFLKDLENRL